MFVRNGSEYQEYRDMMRYSPSLRSLKQAEDRYLKEREERERDLIAIEMWEAEQELYDGAGLGY